MKSIKRKLYFSDVWWRIKMAWVWAGVIGLVTWTICWLFFFPAIGILWLGGLL